MRWASEQMSESEVARTHGSATSIRGRTCVELSMSVAPIWQWRRQPRPLMQILYQCTVIKIELVVGNGEGSVMMGDSQEDVGFESSWWSPVKVTTQCGRQARSQWLEADEPGLDSRFLSAATIFGSIRVPISMGRSNPATSPEKNGSCGKWGCSGGGDPLPS